MIFKFFYLIFFSNCPILYDCTGGGRHWAAARRTALRLRSGLRALPCPAARPARGRWPGLPRCTCPALCALHLHKRAHMRMMTFFFFHGTLFFPASPSSPLHGHCVLKLHLLRVYSRIDVFDVSLCPHRSCFSYNFL